MGCFSSRFGLLGAAALVLGSAVAVVEVRNATAAPAAAGTSVKLTKPWSEIKSLSEEQKVKIHEIHTKALAQVNEIEKQEKADIMAVLTDPQKVELAQAAAADKKAAAEKRAAKATSQPAAKAGK